MLRKLWTALSLATLFISAAMGPSMGRAQGPTSPAPSTSNPPPPSLLEQLQAQYQLARVGGHGAQRALIDPGTVLVVQKGGILGVDPNLLGNCPAKYQKGVLKPPNTMCANMAQTGRNFEAGDKVYVTKIDVVQKDEKVVLKIVACDTCNGVNPPTFYKSQVDFIFPAGYLEKGDVGAIEDTIGEVFALNAIPAPPPAPTADAPPATPPSTPAAAPATIQSGQTIDQVVGILGQPEKKVDLGAKQIFVYKDLKVTFMDGKVSDVQ